MSLLLAILLRVRSCIANVKFGDVLEVHNGIIFDFYSDYHI